MANAAASAAHMVADAATAAKEVVQSAATTIDDRTTHTLANALRQVFGENEEAQRFVDVKKIPLICKSILDIHNNIEEIKEIIRDNNNVYVTKESWKPYKAVLNLIGGSAVLAIIGAIMGLILVNVK